MFKHTQIFLYLLFQFHPIKRATANSSLYEKYKEDQVVGPHHAREGERSSLLDHSTILGSHEEVSEFDHLDSEGVKKRLNEILLKIDLNSDKNIDRKELKSWILHSYRVLAEEESKELLESIDVNGDEVVTWPELVAAYRVEGNETLTAKSQHLFDSDMIMWKVADVNGDNMLNGSEWLVFTHPEEHPEMLPLLIDQTLQQKDLNKDGGIDFQEYIGGETSKHDKEWLRREKERFEHEFDRNRDGRLVGKEILSWIAPKNEDLAEDEVDYFFDTSDDNHDDILSFEEILEHHDIFAGGETTGYMIDMNDKPIHTEL